MLVLEGKKSINKKRTFCSSQMREGSSRERKDENVFLDFALKKV